MNLLTSINLNVSDFHAEKIRLIDEFDYSNVRWKVKEELGDIATEEYLNEGIKNLKKYYVVALLDPLNEHAVSAKVDPFWHCHILFTAEYISFCNSIYNQYVHHLPLNPENTVEVKRIFNLYAYTQLVYQDMFLDHDTNWWPAADSEEFECICSHNRIEDPIVMHHALYALAA